MTAVTRRDALRRIGLLAGGALSASTVAGVLAGCRTEPPGAAYAFRALDAGQQDLLGTLVDLIIPKTDTPGARAAGVPGFIDKMLADWMPDDERARFLAGLADVDARARRAHGEPFVDVSEADQTALLTALDAAAYAEPEPAAEAAADREAAEAATTGSADAQQTAAEDEIGQTAPPDSAGSAAAPPEPPPPFFSTLKELTLAGYYTSEPGATQELQWLAVPGQYTADAPLAEVGRTWA